MSDEQSLLEFPCDFPIKVMGEMRDDFAQLMLAVVLRHAPDFDAAEMGMRTSRNSRYISLTFNIRAVSREQLDDLYRELSDHPAVAMVL